MSLTGEKKMKEEIRPACCLCTSSAFYKASGFLIVFTNPDLKDLEENGAKSIELVKVDGNMCYGRFGYYSRRIIRFLSICLLAELATRRNSLKH